MKLYLSHRVSVRRRMPMMSRNLYRYLKNLPVQALALVRADPPANEWKELRPRGTLSD